MLTPTVSQGIQQMQAALSHCTFTVREDGEGGAWVTVDGLPLGTPYHQEQTWIGFHMTFPYPSADVYPHFVRADLTRVDGKPLGEAISQGSNFEGRAAIQISRKSNRLNPLIDTALQKLLKVLEWLRTRP